MARSIHWKPFTSHSTRQGRANAIPTAIFHSDLCSGSYFRQKKHVKLLCLHLHGSSPALVVSEVVQDNKDLANARQAAFVAARAKYVPAPLYQLLNELKPRASVGDLQLILPPWFPFAAPSRFNHGRILRGAGRQLKCTTNDKRCQKMHSITKIWRQSKSSHRRNSRSP